MMAIRAGDQFPITGVHLSVHEPVRTYDYVNKGSPENRDTDTFPEDTVAWANIRTMEIISGQENAPPFVYYMAFVRNIQSNAGWYEHPFSAVSGRKISTMVHELGHNHSPTRSLRRVRSNGPVPGMVREGGHQHGG
jgi:hypothetical protein